ncbi:hypothetical protein EPN54_05455, partial [bacterium]
RFEKETGVKISFIMFLPFSMTYSDPSPYGGISIFANNSILNSGIRIPEGDRSLSQPRLDYQAVRAFKTQMLKEEFERFRFYIKHNSFLENKFHGYLEEARISGWLEDYTLFHCLLDEHDGAYWKNWDRKLAGGDPSELDKFRKSRADNMLFYAFLQYLFDKQWFLARRYGRSKGVRFIGDLPIYPSRHSAEVWSFQRKGIFNIDKSAGAPPDALGPKGQDWGLPPYRWTEEFEGVLGFWKRHIAHAARYFDAIRFDHILGVCGEWIVPPGLSPTEGYFEPDRPEAMAALGERVIRALAGHAHRNSMLIVGEDLGERPNEVRVMLDSLSEELPNFFLYNIVGWREGDFSKRKKVLIGEANHDTPPTFKDRWLDLSDADKQQGVDLLAAQGLTGFSGFRDYGAELYGAVIDAMCLSDNSLVCFTPQSLFKLPGPQNRINEPGTVGPHNWTWRLPKPNMFNYLDPFFVGAIRRNKDRFTFAASPLEQQEALSRRLDAIQLKISVEVSLVVLSINLWPTSSFKKFIAMAGCFVNENKAWEGNKKFAALWTIRETARRFPEGTIMQVDEVIRELLGRGEYEKYFGISSGHDEFIGMLRELIAVSQELRALNTIPQRTASPLVSIYPAVTQPTSEEERLPTSEITITLLNKGDRLKSIFSKRIIGGADTLLMESGPLFLRRTEGCEQALREWLASKERSPTIYKVILSPRISVQGYPQWSYLSLRQENEIRLAYALFRRDLPGEFRYGVLKYQDDFSFLYDLPANILQAHLQILLGTHPLDYKISPIGNWRERLLDYYRVSSTGTSPLAKESKIIPAIQRIRERGYVKYSHFGLDHKELEDLLESLTGIRMIAWDKRGGVHTPAIKFADFIKRQIGELLKGFKARDKHIRMLVIGTGSGIDSMAAFYEAKSQGFNVGLDAVDIQKEAVDLSNFNFQLAFSG